MRSGSSPRVLYVAFDACDAALMERLAADGTCPSLARLLSESASVGTVAPYGTFVGSSWMTITTGREVFNHRYWNWLEVDPDTYDFRSTTPREAVGRPFWEALSDAGRRVAVLDVPHMDLPKARRGPFNGIVLKEWGCHDRHDGTAASPPDVLAELDALVGRHPVGCRSHPTGADAFAPCDYTLRDDRTRTIDEERRLLELILDGLEAKRRASLRLLDREPWDLFATVFGEGHCAGHQFWHVHDEQHPRHDPAARRLLGDPLVEVYARLDAALGDLVSRAGPTTTVVVQMNHGMGPHFDGDHLFDEILRRIDESLRGRFEPGSWSRVGARLLEHTPERATRAARVAAAAAARWKARRGAPQPSGRPGPSPGRRFFQIPGNTSVGAVRFNVFGRESKGLVRPGAELGVLRQQLAEALLEVVDIDSGRPLVRRVRSADEVLGRRDDDRLPDVFVEWDRSSLVERVWSPRIGTVAAPYEHWRTGDHHDGGLFVVRAPGAEPGRRVRPMSLVDVGPTIAAALGVNLSDVDGSPRSDLLGTAPVSARADDAIAGLTAELGATRAALDDLARSVASIDRQRSIWTTMSFLEHAPVDDRVRVTVITPTHDRPATLEIAIRSVVEQRHRNWELVVVDDGSETAGDVAKLFDDDRIRVVSIEHGGACHARNVGLDHATGDVITYLDDDNRLHPGWLHAVAWAFGNHPGSSILYGARIIDDIHRVSGRGAGGWPWLQFEPFDRRALERDNFADMGVIAHRNSATARFDTTLVECGDWDFFLSLTTDETPLELPVVAFSYASDGTDRLSGRQPGDADVVRAKWARWRAARHTPDGD